jgi:hypothetical protein
MHFGFSVSSDTLSPRGYEDVNDGEEGRPTRQPSFAALFPVTRPWLVATCALLRHRPCAAGEQA